jgi:tRNA pseudouridine synthase 10
MLRGPTFTPRPRLAPPMTTRPLLAPEHVEVARRAQAEFGLCDACLGRRYGKVETGLTNAERGRILRGSGGEAASQRGGLMREAAGADVRSVLIRECFLCAGLLEELDALAEVAIDALAPYEYRHFLIGTRFDPTLEAREAEVNAALGTGEKAERINSEVNREVGKRVAARTGKPVEFKQPDLTAIVDTRFFDAELQFGGLYIFGRYRKFDRTIPQTKWPCRRCQGRGCVECEGTGRQYRQSVEEFVADPFIQASRATEESFHGAGREDIDARTIGTGRPFILELKDPRVRTFDLDALAPLVRERSGGRVEIEGLRWTTKEEVGAIKEHRGSKTYRAKVRFSSGVAAENLLKAVQSLRGAAIHQRTPERVQHRRADLVRERTVLGIDIESADDAGCVLVIHGDAGLYIKELVSGDEGRTEPSLMALLGVPARVEELDIIAVEYEQAP